MSPIPLRFRQVHLDFHTSEHIPAIGAAFDPAEFAATLTAAEVDSITCFARCHHGWLYYGSHAFPERRHPHLTRNLLAEQIAACHAAGIRAPIYLTVQWDHYTAVRHPEWRVVEANGRLEGTPPYEAGFYRRLCVNTSYRDFLKAHVAELFDLFPVDGLFFDIVSPVQCSCHICQALLQQQGLDPADPAVRQQFAVATINGFKQEMTRFVRDHSSDCTIFYNAGHVGSRHRPMVSAYSHFELESLPSGGWGTMHFPLAMRYARNLGLDCLGMTGKFHTTWGDFHSFKNEAALQFECFQMLALGAKCSIGDQLLPNGRLDPTTYQLIGAVYREVAQKEAWCQGAVPLADIGLFTPEAFAGEVAGRVPAAAMGATRMLQELGHQFDLIDDESHFAPYKLLILPDTIPVSAALAEKLTDYIATGGALIASFASGLDPAQEGFALEALGVALADEGPRDGQGELVRGRPFAKHDYAEYILPQGKLGAGLPATEHVMYRRGLAVTTQPGAETLLPTLASYFDRSYRHFCSHNQAPSSGQVRGPAVVQNGRCLYFAHPIFSQYAQNAPRWCRTLLANALDLLLPRPLLRHNGPSTLLATVNAQPAHSRWVVHLLHYIPERRGQDFDSIEDVIPLHDLALTLRLPAGVRPVAGPTAVPQQTPLDFRLEEGVNGRRLHFTLPKLSGHQMIAIELAS